MNKYYIHETKWNDGVISATILKITPEGRKKLIITDDMSTIQEYRSKAERATQGEIDAMWG